MKKNVIYILILFVMSFILTPQISYAALSSDYSDAVRVCDYEIYYDVIRKDESQNSVAKRQMSIFYVPSKDRWEIVFPEIDKTSKINHALYNNDKKPFFMVNGNDLVDVVYGDLKAFRCSTYGYFDISDPSDSYGLHAAPILTNNELSAESDEYWFVTSRKIGFNARKYELKYSQKTYDLSEAANKETLNITNNYLNSEFSVDENKTLQENPFCSKVDTKTAEELEEEYKSSLENAVVTGLKNKFFSNTDMELPSEFLNLEAFANIKNNAGVKVSEAIASCKRIVENDSNLTDEERQEKIEEFDEKAAAIEKVLKNYASNRLNNIDIFDWGGEESCSGFLGSKECNGGDCDPAYYLNLIFNIIKYSAIVLVFALSALDFMKAITSQDKEMLTKATKTAVKRLIIAIIIFFIPIVLNFILGLFGAYDTCGIN